MSSSVIRVNGVEVDTDTSKPAVINININQPSGLYSLIEMVKSQCKGKKTEQATSSVVSKGEQKVLGAVLIMIGLVCVSFGVLLCFLRISSMYWSGSCFWTGFPFIVTGAVAVLSERRPNCLWGTAAFLLHLASLGVAIGGLVAVSGDLMPWVWSSGWPFDVDELCKYRRNDGYYRSYYETTTPEPYDYRVDQCRNAFHRLLNMFNGMKVMVLVATCLALCISLYSLGSGIKRLCFTCAPNAEEELSPGQDREQLLAAKPPAYTEKCSEVQTV